MRALLLGCPAHALAAAARRICRAARRTSGLRSVLHVRWVLNMRSQTCVEQLEQIGKQRAELSIPCTCVASAAIPSAAANSDAIRSTAIRSAAIRSALSYAAFSVSRDGRKSERRSSRQLRSWGQRSGRHLDISIREVWRTDRFFFCAIAMGPAGRFF